MEKHRIAVIPGDGIGRDVTEAARLVWIEAGKKHGFELEETVLPWSCDHYLETGRMMPEDGIERLRSHSAIFLGAVGWPAEVPDDVSLHGLLLPIRKSFDLYVNMRPHLLLPGVEGPLRNRSVDMVCIRENTEGEYSGAGGRVHRQTEHEVAVETSIFTRRAVERILRYGFELARKRSGRLASVTKSNAQRHSMVFWDEVTDALAVEFPDVAVQRIHVDAAVARMVMHPGSLDVIVGSNLFGDILTDLGAALQGGLGFAASANLNPDADVPAMFEPVHGSAPDIAGSGRANPIAAIWSAALMLDWLGCKEASLDIQNALGRLTGDGRLRTPDMGGDANTIQIAEAVAGHL